MHAPCSGGFVMGHSAPPPSPLFFSPKIMLLKLKIPQPKWLTSFAISMMPPNHIYILGKWRGGKKIFQRLYGCSEYSAKLAVAR
jgi:hypothetical protein